MRTSAAIVPAVLAVTLCWPFCASASGTPEGFDTQPAVPAPAEIEATLDASGADAVSSEEQARIAELVEVFDELYSTAPSGMPISDELKGRVRRLRADQSLPTSSRFELAALVETRIRERADAGRAPGERRRAWEQTQRRLMVEFPGEALAYEGLLCVAEQEPDSERALSIARELIQAKTTPNWVARRAQAMVDRQELIGQSLKTVLPETLRGTADGPVATGAPVVIYTWSAQRADSVTLAQLLLARAPEGIRFVGVCLDTDITQAREYAREADLPGECVYDERGVMGLVAQRLVLRDPSIAYLVDGDGIIRSVTYHRDLLAR